MNKAQKTQLLSDLEKFTRRQNYSYTFDELCYDAKRYIKAIKEGRMICNIDSVSTSGMSRTLKFLGMERSKHSDNVQYNLLGFYRLFYFLGYTKVNNSDYFRVYGCGMDMVFNTNY